MTTIYEDKYFTDGMLNIPFYQFFVESFTKLKNAENSKEEFDILFRELDDFISYIDHTNTRLGCYRELKAYLRSINSKHVDEVDETFTMSDDEQPIIDEELEGVE